MIFFVCVSALYHGRHLRIVLSVCVGVGVIGILFLFNMYIFFCTSTDFIDRAWWGDGYLSLQCSKNCSGWHLKLFAWNVKPYFFEKKKKKKKKNAKNVATIVIGTVRVQVHFDLIQAGKVILFYLHYNFYKNVHN